MSHDWGSIFQVSDFDLQSDGTYCQEFSQLQGKYNNAIARIITLRDGVTQRHFQIEKVDRTPIGDTAGWWYFEIGGTGKVLIIND
jgi:hypothetical protein